MKERDGSGGERWDGRGREECTVHVYVHVHVTMYCLQCTMYNVHLCNGAVYCLCAERLCVDVQYNITQIQL